MAKSRSVCKVGVSLEHLQRIPRAVVHTRGSSSGFGNPPVKRYTLSRSGERVLIGLSLEETREFERAARVLPSGLYDVASKRWFALYAKHEQGWKRRLAELPPRKER